MSENIDDTKISFQVDVATNNADENLDKVIKKIDDTKKSISDLQKEIKSNKEDETMVSQLTHQVNDLQRELQKLQSVYSGWIQKSINIDTKPIGDVKKQLQELYSVINNWDGNSESFKGQVLSRFLIPNSAIDQAKTYKTILQEIDGLNLKNYSEKLQKAHNEFQEQYSTALANANHLNKEIANGGGIYDALRQAKIHGEDFAATLLQLNKRADTLAKKIAVLKNAMNELAVSPKGHEDEIKSIQAMYTKLEGYKQASNDLLNAEKIAAKQKAEQEKQLAKETADYKKQLAKEQREQERQAEKERKEQAKADAEAIKARAKAEAEAAKPINRFKDWNGQGNFLGNISLPANLEQRMNAIKNIMMELKGQFGSDAAQADKLNVALKQCENTYKKLKADVDKVKESLKDQAVIAVETAKKAEESVKEQATSARTAAQEYMKLKEAVEEVQAQIKLNYINNRKNDPDLYAKNQISLFRNYKELSSQLRDAEQHMELLAFNANKTGLAFDRLRKRMVWVLSAFGANMFTDIAHSWFDFQTETEKSMAQFAQVMQHGIPVVSGLESLSKQLGATEINVNTFGKSLNNLSFNDVLAGVRETTSATYGFQKQLSEMQQSIINLAIKYGETNKDVAESATLWGRMYKDNNVVLTLTNAAMRLAVADSFSVIEANKNLESSIAQWGFQIKNNNDAMTVSNKICDSWTAIAHNMAVSAQDLSAANQRAASSMHAAGIEFDVGQALLATMIRNTQQAGGEIGNAMKSIIGSIHSDKAVAEIEKMGVAVYEFDAQGQKHFRNVGQVLVDLMIKTQGTEKSLESMLQKISGGKLSHLPQPLVMAA